MYQAAKKGYRDIIDLMLPLAPHCAQGGCYGAIVAGNLELFKYIQSHSPGVQLKQSSMLSRAAKSGYKFMVEHFLEQGATAHELHKAVSMANWKGHHEIVEYLVEKGATEPTTRHWMKNQQRH